MEEMKKLLQDTNPRDWRLNTMLAVAKHFKLDLSKIRERDELEKELRRLLCTTNVEEGFFMDQKTLRVLATAFANLNGHDISDSKTITVQYILELSKRCCKNGDKNGESSDAKLVKEKAEQHKHELSTTDGSTGRKRKFVASSNRVLRSGSIEP